MEANSKFSTSHIAIISILLPYFYRQKRQNASPFFNSLHPEQAYGRRARPVRLSKVAPRAVDDSVNFLGQLAIKWLNPVRSQRTLNLLA